MTAAQQLREGSDIVGDDVGEPSAAHRNTHARLRIAVILVSLLAAALGMVAMPAPSYSAPASAQTTEIAPAQVVTHSVATAEAVPTSQLVAAGAPVALIVYYIMRYGLPWLIRNAPTLYHSMVANYLVRVQVCRSLRANGNGWGWSPFCWGT